VALKEQRHSVIAKLVGTRNEIEDLLNLSSPALVLSPNERDELSATVRTLDSIALRLETDS
jgi:hypothetical protein